MIAKTKVVRIDLEVALAVEKHLEPVGGSVAKYVSDATKARLIKDKVRNAERIGGKRK